jgi:replicative DNA helicase
VGGLSRKRPPAQLQLYSEEAEKELLGSTLLDPDGSRESFDAVPLEAYYLERNRILAGVIRDLYEERFDVSPVAIIDRLRGSGQLEAVGSVPYIMGLMETLATAAYSWTSAQVVLERMQRRKLLEFSQETAALVRDEGLTIDELYGSVETRLTSLRGDRGGQDVDAFFQQAAASLDPDTTPMMPTGLRKLDDIIGGFVGLFIIGARPSMGKSSLLRDILRHQAERGNKVALFSMDQAGSDVLALEASRRSQVSYSLITQRKASAKQRDAWSEALKETRDEFRRLYRIDQRVLTLDVLASSARAAARWGARVIAVDYLQLVKVPGVDAEHLTHSNTAVSKLLKELAQELEVPIVAAAQLNRQVEMRRDKRPTMADLRESGQIAQDANIVALLYRGEYYDARDQGRAEELESYAEVNIAKNKIGPTGTARLVFESRYATFRS